MVELALATPNTRQDGPGEVLVESNLIVEKRGNHSAFCKWNISSFAHAKQKTLWSKYFEVGGYDCRLLVYPTGRRWTCRACGLHAEICCLELTERSSAVFINIIPSPAKCSVAHEVVVFDFQVIAKLSQDT